MLGAPLPVRANLLARQLHDPIPSAEADYLSDLATTIGTSGGVDPVDLTDEFTAMMLAVRTKAAADYAGTYEYAWAVQTPGAQLQLAAMLRAFDPVYAVDAPPIVYRNGVLMIRWRIDGAGIYTP